MHYEPVDPKQMEEQAIQTLSTIRKEFKVIHNVNKIHRDQLSTLDKLALFITKKVGTMGFFFLIFGWTVVWLGFNIFAPATWKFDPYPAFVLWLFISNLIQLHLMPLIMIGQNLQGKHAELRAEHDFETDRKAEKEIETILLRLEQQEKMIQQLLKNNEQSSFINK